MGLYAKALIPISDALSLVIFLLYPVHKITEIVFGNVKSRVLAI